jgi:hypothetical protein
MGVDPTQQVEESAAPAATEVTPVVEAPPATPWRKELDEFFADQPEDVRTKVDSYIATKRQPYVTKLEQDRAELAEKAAWFEDLQEDPDSVLRDAIEQTYSPEAATKFLALIAEGVTPAEAAEEVAAPHAALAPEDRAALDRAKARDEEEALASYLKEVDTLVEANPHVVADSFHFYVEKAGDIEGALALWNKHFPPPAAGVVEDPAIPTPPATLTGGGGGTPVAKAALTLDELGSALFDSARGR